MKNLTLVLVLSMAAFAGCKKKDDAGAGTGSGLAAAGSGAEMTAGSGSGSGATMAAGSGSAAGGGSAAPAGGALDCAAAFDHTMSLEKDNMKKEMPNMTDDMFVKIRNLAVQHCKDDKWGDDVLHCFGDGKTADEVDKCDEKLTKEQKEKFNKDMEATMTAMMGSGAAGSGAAPAGGGASLPKECQDYAAAMEKLAKCDKMPAASKDGLKQAFEAMKQGWAQLDGMPPEALKAMTDGCKQAADALMQSGKTVCGW